MNEERFWARGAGGESGAGYESGAGGYRIRNYYEEQKKDDAEGGAERMRREFMAMARGSSKTQTVMERMKAEVKRMEIMRQKQIIERQIAEYRGQISVLRTMNWMYDEGDCRKWIGELKVEAVGKIMGILESRVKEIEKELYGEKSGTGCEDCGSCEACGSGGGCEDCGSCEDCGNGEAGGDQRAKEDSGKLRLELVPREIIRDIAAVREYGTRKYKDPENWRRVEEERFRNAAFRHFLAFLDEPEGADEESGLPHLWHLACNIAFLCEKEKERGTWTGKNF